MKFNPNMSDSDKIIAIENHIERETTFQYNIGDQLDAMGYLDMESESIKCDGTTYIIIGSKSDPGYFEIPVESTGAMKNLFKEIQLRITFDIEVHDGKPYSFSIQYHYDWIYTQGGHNGKSIQRAFYWETGNPIY